MADTDDFQNAKLYDEIVNEKETEVLERCQRFPDGPLHVLTIHKDTVLHLALYYSGPSLVRRLLNSLTAEQRAKIAHKNEVGSTILHEVAPNDEFVPAAEEMVRLNPELLFSLNDYGETPLFRSARYGQIKMFKCLAREMRNIKSEAECRTYHRRRSTTTTILHTSIVSEHFELAKFIVEEYPYLIEEPDKDGLTALQLLAINPLAFKPKRYEGVLQRLLYAFACCRRLPWLESFNKEKQRYESARKLAEILIVKDKSWKASSMVEEQEVRTHEYYGDKSLSSSRFEEAKKLKTPRTPLFMATKSGSVEIVQEILRVYPQAIEHIDDEKNTILHLAIKYRQMEILDIVERMTIPMRRLVKKVDKDSNSILHMVGERRKHNLGDAIRSPAFKLQEDLLLYERIEELCSGQFFKHKNYQDQTAEELFTYNNEELRLQAQEWLKRTAEQCSIVAVFIATVAFTAAYTVPGGPNQNTGFPILLNQPFFVMFTISDVLSLTFTLTSVITFLSILTSSFELQDFKLFLPQKLMIGVSLLLVSVAMMMLSFAATIILMIRNKQQWTKIALYAAAFLPVTSFAFTCVRLYAPLMPTARFIRVFDQAILSDEDSFPSNGAVAGELTPRKMT